MDRERTMEPVTPASKVMNLSVLPPQLREALAEFAHGTASAGEMEKAREAARIMLEAEGEMAQRLSSLRRTAPR